MAMSSWIHTPGDSFSISTAVCPIACGMSAHVDDEAVGFADDRGRP